MYIKQKKYLKTIVSSYINIYILLYEFTLIYIVILLQQLSVSTVHQSQIVDLH